MQKVSQEIDASNSKFKTMHPSLGMLSALEWYSLIEMHFRHHLRQKKEIDKTIRSYYKETASPSEELTGIEEETDTNFEP